MKKSIIAVTLLAFVTACSATSQTAVNTVTNNACDIYRTIAWALPVVEGLIPQGKLNATEMKIAADAKSVLDTGCQPGNETLLARAQQAAASLIQIIYKP